MKNLLILILANILVSCSFIGLPNGGNAGIEVTDIQIAEIEEIVVGDYTQLNVIVYPSNATNQTLIWTASDTSIANINSDGVVIAIAPGTTTITATAADGSLVFDQITILVIEVGPVAVDSISISGNETIVVAHSTQLVATIEPSNASNTAVVWTVDDDAFAEIDRYTGLINAIAEGTVTITATATDGSDVYAEHILSISNPAPSSTIIIDHESVDLFENLNDYWINEAKKCLIIISGESHGRGYGYGLELLEAYDSRFEVHPKWSGAAEAYREDGLRWNRSFLDNTTWNISCGEEDFWTNSTARADVLTGLQTIDATYIGDILFGVGWCWDMERNTITSTKDPTYGCGWAGSTSGGPDGNLAWGIDDGDNSVTGNSLNLGDYLEAVATYNAGAPGVKTIFTTGTADSYHNSEAAYQRHLKNEAIRSYVTTNGGILFDYNDILSWDYENNQSPDDESWTDSSSVVHTWRGSNRTLATGGTGFDGGDGGSHISEEACLIIGKALWVMAAMNAGWDGTP